MNSDVYMKTGDLQPALAAVLLDEANDPIDLTSATVQFTLSRNGTKVVDNAGAQISGDPLLGQVIYVWQAGNTDTPGLHQGEFIVLKAGRRTVPNNGFITVFIEKGL